MCRKNWKAAESGDGRGAAGVAVASRLYKLNTIELKECVPEMNHSSIEGWSLDCYLFCRCTLFYSVHNVLKITI